MNQVHVDIAVAKIMKSEQANVSFNVPVNDSYSNVHPVIIHKCNATLIKELIDLGFSLYMTEKGLSLDCFKPVA